MAVLTVLPRSVAQRLRAMAGGMILAGMFVAAAGATDPPDAFA